VFKPTLPRIMIQGFLETGFPSFFLAAFGSSSSTYLQLISPPGYPGLAQDPAPWGAKGFDQ